MQFWLAWFYAEDVDVADVNKTVRYYEKCLKLNPAYESSLVPILERDIGIQYLYHGDNSDRDDGLARNWLQKAADKDDAEAQFELGQCYFEGWGVGPDREEAVRWYRVAADKGHVEAQRELGKCYLYGWGVDPDDGVGIELLRKAATDKDKIQGDPEAKFQLGKCYRYGWGCVPDPNQARVLFYDAGRAGNHPALRELGRLFLDGNKEMGIRPDVQRAINYLKQAIDGNNPDAEAARLLGKCYYSGKGVGSENKKEAQRLYQIAANGGDAKAMYNLAVCYLTGAGGEKNPDAAIFWAEKAIESEDESVVEDAKKLLDKIPVP